MEKEQNDTGKKAPEAKKKEVRKEEKKKIFGAMERRQKIAIGVIIVVAISSVVGGISIYANMPKGGTFIYGTGGLPSTLDPLFSWTFNHIDIINQIAEGLLDYDLTSENNNIIPNLATNWIWSSDGKQITFTLRQGVKFHDGTIFDAAAAKWNFDRNQRLVSEMFTAPLWLFPDGRHIINQTVVVDDYTLRLELNEVYIPLLGLLASWSSYFLSPESTPADRMLELTENLVGTGPYIYDLISIEQGEVSFTPNSDYWGGKPLIDKLVFSIFSDSEVKHAAMLSKDISMIKAPDFQMLDTFENTPGITVKEGDSSLIIEYLAMNNKQIPVEMRKAISYALNYSYIIDELYDRYATRCRSPIPKGVLYSNTEDFDVPVMDLTIARQALIDANWPGTTGLTANDDDSPGNEWEALVTGGTPLASYNYSYPKGNAFREDLLILCQRNFKQIGVEVIDAGMLYIDLITRIFDLWGNHKDMLQLYFEGWAADYNDPSNFIDMLCSNKANSNGAQVDDAQLEEWIDQAVRETDPIMREQLYYNIQKRLIEEIYPYCWVSVPKNFDVYVSNLRGWHSSAMKLSFKTVYFV